MLSSGWNPRLLFGLLLPQENKHRGKKKKFKEKMKRTLPKRETERENYPHTMSRRCPFSSHGLHDPWKLIDAEEEEKSYINNNNNNTRERMMMRKQQSPPVHRQDKNRQRRRQKRNRYKKRALKAKHCGGDQRQRTKGKHWCSVVDWLMRKIHKTLTLTLIWIQNDIVCVDVFVHMSSICVSLMVVVFFFLKRLVWNCISS